MELQRKVADLEAKLAESEADKKALICDYESRITKEQELMSWLEHNNEELKQQLAEWQDGTIICKWTDAENKVKELEQQLSEKEELIMFADRTIKGLVLAKEIDKISFCIEKLTDIRSFVSDATEIKEPDYTKVCNYIDNQIASLKKGVE